MIYKTLFTDYGLDLVARAAAEGEVIRLSFMAVGDGNGNPVEPAQTAEFLARERYRAGINSLVIDPRVRGSFTAELVIPAEEGGFTIREAGLYDADGKLVAISNVPDSYKPTPSEGAFSDTVVRMSFTVSNADVVQLVIDPNTAVATHSWVINNVTASTVIPGGLTGQVLSKKSNSDGDVEWIDPAGAVEVIAWSREETQTLAGTQNVIDLAFLNTQGVALYVEGVRLRADEFTVSGPTQLILHKFYPDGARVTAVQNEEVGKTEVLARAANLADLLDVDAARRNLGLSEWLGTQQIAWARIVNAPAYAKRWPKWSEVDERPTAFTPAEHEQPWSSITAKPETATRWPTWNEVSGKPTAFTPASHGHAEYLSKTNPSAQTVASAVTFEGMVRAPIFRPTSSRKVKRDIEELPYGLEQVMALRPVLWRPLFSDDLRGGLIAEEVAESIPVAVDIDSEVPGIDYAPVVATLVAAVQELARRVSELEGGE